MSININRANNDPYYRYKMPRIIAKVEGKGNGIKTVIVNMTEIAKSLQRPPSYPTKYFGCELGAQTQLDSKNDRYIVNGSHDGSKLQEILDGFIKKFVLCPECENPETDLSVDSRKEKIKTSCLACGYHGLIDLRHKLSTFILKYPPNSESTKKGKGKKGRNEKKAASKTSAGTTSIDNAPVNVSINTSVNGHSDRDDWSADTSEAAVKERMENLSAAAKGLTLSDDLERSEKERLDIFYTYAEKLKKENKIIGKENNVFAEAERLDVPEKATLILCELLFNADFISQIKLYRQLFVRFVGDRKYAKKCQRYLMNGFEILVGKSYPQELMSKVTQILHTLYDQDYVEEESLLHWYTKLSKKYISKEVGAEIRQKAEPFIKWLKEAEEESAEEEDDIVYSNEVPEEKKVEEDDNDIDIDNI
ncbi:Eukaryotic translation initiation factor 5 [Trichoplax sp. H2]|nr:Eukaryotic translation initiation factor 5 [Trichoplax sp. H2]|eukprot:RDD40730.1 Eukaryotic translation initiation factor 5 [Trichoplax sp. H2]